MSGKASFDDIYDQPDPRAYIRELSELEYQIPAHASGVFRYLIGHLRDRSGDGLTVADLCCSYGFNPALFNHDLTLDELFARYAAPEVAALGPHELAAADRDFYAARRRDDAVPAVGLDAAGNAIDYARRTGILDVAAAENLEADEPSEELRRDLAPVGLVTVTGGIGYITETTFDRVLEAAGAQGPPWIAAFTLRWVDMEPIAVTLEEHGLVLERLEGHTFRQRRFADGQERAYALAELRRIGVDPDGVETDGYHHTWLYLARPIAEAKTTPIDELLAPALEASRD